MFYIKNVKTKNKKENTIARKSESNKHQIEQHIFNTAKGTNLRIL